MENPEPRNPGSEQHPGKNQTDHAKDNPNI
jgi:hypothetical protein